MSALMDELRADEREWLIVKRDLFYRPEYCGYTGIRDYAGRYTEAEAKDHVGDGLSGVSMVRLADAPEFTNACFDDLAREHLQKQRDEARAELTTLQSRVEAVKAERDAALDDAFHAEEAFKTADEAGAYWKARVEELQKALEPFSDLAGEMFARGWDASNVALALDNPNDAHRVTAGDFFRARALSPARTEEGKP